MILNILPLLLASIGLPPEDMAAVEDRAAAIFAPYTAPEVDPTPSWERPIFSQEVSALIAHWLKVMPEDEPDELNDADWFCQCQDWDKAKFKATLYPVTPLTEDTVEVEGKIELFGEEGGIRDVRLIFKREAGDWRLDDMTGDSYPRGLKQALRETIAADEARRAGKTPQ